MRMLRDAALVHDIRLATRSLRRTPMFTLIATLSLTLGLAVAFGTVSLVNAYAQRAIPYEAADRIYHLAYAPPGPWEPRGMTGLDWASLTDVVEHPIAALSDGLTLADGGYAASMRGLRATRGFTEGLGLRVTIGRTFADHDFVSGSEHVALIGYSVWRDRFGASSDVIGRVVRVEPDSAPGSRETLHIIGVLPRGFFFGRDSSATIDFLIPEASPQRAYMVRLRSSVRPETAVRRITDAARAAATAPIPGDWGGVRLESVYERYVSSLRPILTGLTIAVALLLVIVGANLAVLMLLRSLRGQKDNAVRMALGASRLQIARCTLTESSIVTGVALAAGLGLTALALSGLSPLIQTQLGRPSLSPAGIAIDATGLGVVAAVSLLVVLAISVAPLVASRGQILNALRQDSRVSTDSGTTRRIRHVLIAFEVAASLILLIGCGLMVGSVSAMTRVDLGFDPDGIARSRVMLKTGKYSDAAAYGRFHDAFASHLSASIGSIVAFSTWPPYVEAPSRRIETDGAAADAGMISVSPGYFALFDIPIRRGRAFEAGDLSSTSVAIVSETLAGRLWAGGDGVGRRVRLIDQTSNGLVAGPWRTIVGIAKDVRQSYDDPDRGDFYMPRLPDGRYGTFYVRAAGPLKQTFDAMRSAAADIDPDAVISEPHILADDDQRLTGTRFMTRLLAGFAGAAAFLAMLGLYGVTAYTVEQRQKEVAIRMALGASDRRIIRMFVRSGAILIGTGTAVGLGGALLLTRGLHHQLFGLQNLDLSIYVVASSLLAAAGLAAVWWPARRVTSYDPARSLNAD